MAFARELSVMMSPGPAGVLGLLVALLAVNTGRERDDRVDGVLLFGGKPDVQSEAASEPPWADSTVGRHAGRQD
jgi:hypothetical protein